mmetsp:Transcript_19780/g.32501  ORF Transcript_19780/g.32501 Transcript_19780/m.32501 type:complete len:177 (+) Transcript_19780:402-932(+)
MNLDSDLGGNVPRGYVQAESSTSQSLQVCLHYNLVLSTVFFVLECYVISYKLGTYELEVFGQVLTPLTFSVWASSEGFRLWFGYTGNLQEKLPQLSVFMLLSLFPQLPCLIYLLHLQELQLPFERAMSASLVVFVCFELLIGYMTIKSLVKKQTQSYFQLLVEEEQDDFDEFGRKY